MENQENEPQNPFVKPQDQKAGAMNQADENNQQNANAQSQSQAAEGGGANYGASYQNEENDSSKEENEYKDGQSTNQNQQAQNQAQAPNDGQSNTFGQTTTNKTGGYGDQEDDLANEGDGSGTENQFDGADADEDKGTFGEDNEESSLEEKGGNGL